MKKQLTITITIATLLGFGGLGYYQNTRDTTQENTTQTVQKPEVAPVNEINVSEDGTQLSHQGVSGETALTTLKSLVSVETQSSDFGEFVTSINGLAADSNSEYWAFYVNGELASVGAGSYETQDGDVIEWKLEIF